MLPLREDIQALKGHTTPRVSIVRSGALGDTILLLPTLELLQSALPEVQVTVVGSAWAEKLLPLLPRPCKFFPFDSSTLTPLFVREDCEDSSGVLSGADLAVVYTSEPGGAFVRNVRRLCRGAVIPWPIQPAPGLHAACHFASAATEKPPRPAELPLPVLRVRGEARERAAAWLAERGASKAACFAVIHPGSGGERKCWPARSFAELVDALACRGAQCILLKGPADERACEAVCRQLSGSERVLTAEFEQLEDVAALISCADLYVGNDSGMTHMAAALGVPTVAVFGPTDPEVWRPLGRAVKVVGAVSPSAGRQAWPEPEIVLEAAIQRPAVRRQ